MSNESKLVLEIWENFRDLITPSKREDAALALLRSFEEYGFEFDLLDLQDEDSYLDIAIEMLREEELEEDEEDSYDEL